MPWPRAELSGRLRYRGGARGPRLSLLHLKLTDPALRALRDCQRLQGSAQPVIAFQGSQGYIKIPCALGSPAEGARLFTFYLSRYSKDKPQASFDCIRQYVSRLGQSQLDCVGSIQEKITVCATDDSYQLTRARVSQAEKEAWSRAAIEIKPAAPGHGKCVAIPKKLGMSTPLRKCPTGSPVPGGRKCSPMGTDRRVLVKCLVQLLALRPHCKHELLERLNRVQISLKDRAQLLPMLQEVGQLNPRESSYSLKEELFGQVQEDWLGYTAEEQQQVRQLLRRKQAHGAVDRPFLVPLECPSCQGASRRPLGVKRLALLDASDPQGLKKPCAQEHPSSSLGSHRSLQEPGLEHRRAQSQRQPCQLPRPSAELQSSEEETSDGEGGDDWEEGALRLEQHLTPLQDSSSRASPPFSFAELPDYCRKYRAICSVEQHHAYMEAFSADYAEYRRLHTRVGHVSRTFIQLGAKIKTLPHGTQEHKAVEDRILQEYRRFKQTYPSYRKEKDRCEYLHQKLSHIKGLILEFEKTGAA
ncbi:RNA polymerase II elongation factor ELL3 [Malaclemys terrapin pileata]|uniref:RNA polymerase II elongation factor ELL3 n=1 Tax=Malaclemys terrapin pileata TaxID=2991368 RepID=UPI0023A8BBAA|nr:RNA polymerase II elongation factor ELL3 [Malaclemys terrapin pileata]